jgi:hypothetical protein
VLKDDGECEKKIQKNTLKDNQRGKHFFFHTIAIIIIIIITNNKQQTSLVSL